jgi:hypothetical protein
MISMKSLRNLAVAALALAALVALPGLAAGQGCPSGPVNGELTAGDPVFNRPVGFGGSCSLSGVGTAVHYDVYSFELAGPAPHDLFASLVSGTTMDTIMVFYQAPGGTQNPFNPAAGCTNSVAYNDDFGGTLQSQITGTGLGAGWIDVVVTTFDNGTTGTYTMQVSSQSCLGEIPDMDLSPLSLAATQAPDTTTQQQLTIANVGEGSLEWTIAEEGAAVPTRPGQGSGSGSPLRLGTPAPATRSAAELGKLLEAALADVVQDGGFEAGSPNPFWTEASTNFGTPLCDLDGCGTGTGTGPLTGDWWAWFGGVAAAEAGSVSQSVTIPAGGAATLSFWVEQFVCSGAAADYLEVNIDGTQLWQTTGADPACGVLGYRQITLDVSAYADGGAHTLEFNSEIFGTPSLTNFFVDDVTLEAGPCQQAVDIPWLSVAPANGSTASGASTQVDVTFDSTGLAPGTYSGNLCVDSNDPDPGPGNGTDLVVVPVQLTVEDAGPGPSVLEIPTLGAAGAALLGLALAGLGLGAMRRRRS